MLIHSKNTLNVHLLMSDILRDILNYMMKCTIKMFFTKVLITWGNDDCDMLSGKNGYKLLDVV